MKIQENPILGQCSVFFVDFRTHFFKLFGKPASHTFYEVSEKNAHMYERNDIIQTSMNS